MCPGGFWLYSSLKIPHKRIKVELSLKLMFVTEGKQNSTNTGTSKLVIVSMLANRLCL